MVKMVSYINSSKYGMIPMDIRSKQRMNADIEEERANHRNTIFQLFREGKDVDSIAIAIQSADKNTPMIDGSIANTIAHFIHTKNLMNVILEVYDELHETICRL